MLDLVRPPNLDNRHFGGRELFANAPTSDSLSLGAGRVRSVGGKFQQGRHNHRRSNSSTRDPNLGLLEGPCEFANIFRAAPKEGRLSPIDDIALRKHKPQHQNRWIQGQLDLHSSAGPIACQLTAATKLPGTGLGRVVRCPSRQEIVGDQVVNTSRHTMRCKLEEWKGIMAVGLDIDQHL